MDTSKILEKLQTTKIEAEAKIYEILQGQKAEKEKQEAEERKLLLEEAGRKQKHDEAMKYWSKFEKFQKEFFKKDLSEIDNEFLYYLICILFSKTWTSISQNSYEIGWWMSAFNTIKEEGKQDEQLTPQ